MSLVFTNYDRTQMCDHVGVLGRMSEDGTRTCIRCGKTVKPESFAESSSRDQGRVSRRRVSS
jgi:hypothetical protein